MSPVRTVPAGLTLKLFPPVVALAALMAVADTRPPASRTRSVVAVVAALVGEADVVAVVDTPPLVASGASDRPAVLLLRTMPAWVVHPSTSGADRPERTTEPTLTVLPNASPLDDDDDGAAAAVASAACAAPPPSTDPTDSTSPVDATATKRRWGVRMSKLMRYCFLVESCVR